MSMYKTFGTDVKNETSGIWIDYGEFRVKIARAGGANKKFKTHLEAQTKPHRRAIDNESMDDDVSEEILRKVYIRTVIKGWETKVDGKWVSGIEPPEGDKLLPYNEKNMLATFNLLPDLFMDLVGCAMKASMFRAEEAEIESGN